MQTGTVVAVGIAIIVAFSALAYSWYANITMSDQISALSETPSSKFAELRSSIDSVQGQISSIQSSLTQNQKADTTSDQLIASLQASIKTLESKFSTVSSQLDTTKSSNTASLQQISSQLQSINATVKTLSAKLNTISPQIPQSTLIIVGNSYNNITKTFTFVVQNTQSNVIYAQLSATLLSIACSNNVKTAGTYMSQVYTFKPGQNTNTTMELRQGTYLVCNQYKSISSFSMNIITAPNIAVSPTYTFNVAPPYPIP